MFFFSKTLIMKYKFKTGACVEGSAEQILAIAKSLGETVDLTKLEGEIPRGYYLSEKNGLIEIKGMPDMHIRNALLKRSKTFYETLSSKHRSLSNESFTKEFVSLGEDSVVVDLFSELSKRKKLEKIS